MTCTPRKSVTIGPLLVVVFVLLFFAARRCLAQAQPALWTDAEKQTGYVVFRHSTLELLRDDHVPPRDRRLREWDSVPIELAPGESESIYIGVHNIQGPPLIDTWAEPTVSSQNKLAVQVYFRDGEIHQLVPGKVISRIPVGRTGGFWLTITARPDAPAGKRGIRLEIIPANHGRKMTILQLDVQVRPFVLPRARASFAAYYALSITGIPMGWVRYTHNTLWRAACYRNMADYGMTGVDFRPLGPLGSDAGDLLIDGDTDKGIARLDAELALTSEAGLTDPKTPVVLLEGQVPQDPAALRAFAPKLLAYAKGNGWPESLIYTRDEPPYPADDVRPHNLRFVGTPLRTVTSLGIHAAYGHGDVIDVWLMYGGHITPELRAEARRLGVEVWSYSCHIDSAQPIRNRFYAGLYSWAHGVGGNWIWAYYRNLFHNRLVWSESADYQMYPRVGHENRRDGIDDYRYLQLLQDTIAAKPDDPATREASNYLDALRARVIETDPHLAGPGEALTIAEFDEVRKQVAEFVEQIGAVPSRDHCAWRAPGLKDEAAPYRGASIDACIAGLRSADGAARRSAAWSLFERGSAAAPATEALARVLADPEVRIPALRVLERIGPKAAAATPHVAALLDHEDEFVRLGAVYALKAFGAPAIEGLRKALGDESLHVAYIAGTAAAQIGAPANVLVGELAANLRSDKRPTIVGHVDGAELAIKALGPRAAAAVPAIVELYVSGRRPNMAGSYVEMLSAIGPAAAERVRQLIESDQLDDQRKDCLLKLRNALEAARPK